MLHIPDATIHTLRELMEPGSQIKFAAHIGKLTGTARHFFETEFASKEFEQTKRQVAVGYEACAVSCITLNYISTR